MVLTPINRPPMSYVVAVAQPSVDGHPLLEFEPTDKDDHAGRIYVRYRNPMSNPVGALPVHGAGVFSDDAFGAQAFTTAAYQCATRAQISDEGRRSGRHRLHRDFATPSGHYFA